MKRQARNALMDKAHKGFVWACLGLTAYGSYLIALKVHRYITVVRPLKQAYEKELLQKGEAKENANKGLQFDKTPELKM